MSGKNRTVIISRYRRPVLKISVSQYVTSVTPFTSMTA